MIPITPIVAILLAIYGWLLITRLAKRREAYDLYSSIIVLLEQIEADGEGAWKTAQGVLDAYTVLRLLAKLAAVEHRVRLIRAHYNQPARLAKPAVSTEEITELRNLLTTPDALMHDRGEARIIAIHSITTNLVADLLEESYEHINKRRWMLA
ncbi:MAG: hypothetical protein ACR2P7_07790 [bacterium]